ncbi:hypothetical protein QFC21_004676 [Naganishia friedmannii]|uniref:Uncharacterized protein n=1 Tax=Naganishia friedmannii TaxID=89922 RepID=A0ACC2VEW5_9TREE|nr:hypothetical protein QFC21_004676 [Naganishia friedmannii]
MSLATCTGVTCIILILPLLVTSKPIATAGHVEIGGSTVQAEHPKQQLAADETIISQSHVKNNPTTPAKTLWSNISLDSLKEGRNTPKEGRNKPSQRTESPDQGSLHQLHNQGDPLHIRYHVKPPLLPARQRDLTGYVSQVPTYPQPKPQSVLEKDLVIPANPRAVAIISNRHTYQQNIPISSSISPLSHSPAVPVQSFAENINALLTTKEDYQHVVLAALETSRPATIHPSTCEPQAVVPEIGRVHLQPKSCMAKRTPDRPRKSVSWPEDQNKPVEVHDSHAIPRVSQIERTTRSMTKMEKIIRRKKRSPRIPSSPKVLESLVLCEKPITQAYKRFKLRMASRRLHLNASCRPMAVQGFVEYDNGGPMDVDVDDPVATDESCAMEVDEDNLMEIDEGDSIGASDEMTTTVSDQMLIDDFAIQRYWNDPDIRLSSAEPSQTRHLHQGSWLVPSYMETDHVYDAIATYGNGYDEPMQCLDYLLPDSPLVPCPLSSPRTESPMSHEVTRGFYEYSPFTEAFINGTDGDFNDRVHNVRAIQDDLSAQYAPPPPQSAFGIPDLQINTPLVMGNVCFEALKSDSSDDNDGYRAALAMRQEDERQARTRREEVSISQATPLANKTRKASVSLFMPKKGASKLALGPPAITRPSTSSAARRPVLFDLSRRSNMQRQALLPSASPFGKAMSTIPEEAHQK